MFIRPIGGTLERERVVSKGSVMFVFLFVQWNLDVNGRSTGHCCYCPSRRMPGDMCVDLGLYMKIQGAKYGHCKKYCTIN